MQAPAPTRTHAQERKKAPPRTEILDGAANCTFGLSTAFRHLQLQIQNLLVSEVNMVATEPSTLRISP